MAWKRLIFLFFYLTSIVEAKEFNLKKIISLEEPWGSTFISNTELLISEKSGKIKLLNVINNPATVIPKSKGALISDRKLIPDARIAFISLSSDNRPNVIRVDNRTAIGTDKAMIHARLRNKYSNMVKISKPLPRNRSTARIKKFMNKRKVIINKENKNGKIISRIKYLDNSRCFL